MKTLMGSQVYRKNWRAEFEETDRRAVGKLYNEKIFVREFNCIIRNGSFSVDVANGSGVKVRFRIPVDEAT